ncbi:tumor necrosis factor receptor superfamily member 5 isoform X2 [Toxotes jaculatrix]|uniref:tumor necrosis factor receptor superfamily member 5 isoform X2 n=1 Tax=Toxotes jaculatrix TaxID=941984 RepID=UPI001B3AAE6B|nr:tumor necrosis factor receptor superfamily member 5 isoform X2 [Toxotes jaculatrix]
MLRYITPGTTMHLLWITMMCALVVTTAAQGTCDPVTQQEVDGQCCTKCGPGTSRSSRSTCLDPQCEECGQNEYQDKYTYESKCQRQPYCDENRHFQPVEHESKKKKTICLCKVGFHCSSDACITCVPHTVCRPGYEAKSIGNHTYDTVCQKCPEGSFSSIESWNSSCKKWTECQDGYHTKQRGTDTTDNVCVKTTRYHTILVLVFPVLGIVLIVIITFFLCKGGAQQRNCFESCQGGEQEELKNHEVLILPPSDQNENEPMFSEQQSQEECGSRTPEENEDELSQVVSAGGVALTDNGKYVMQERGKTEILSRQESQTQTFTD